MTPQKSVNKLYWPDLLKEDRNPNEFKLKLSHCAMLSSEITQITEEYKKAAIENSKKNPNYTVIAEYKERMTRFKDANKVLLKFKRKEK